MLKPFQPGLIPVGHFDFDDDQINNLNGGELAVFDTRPVSRTDRSSPDIYVDTNRLGLRRANDLDNGPFYFVDPDVNGDGLSGIAFEKSSLFATGFGSISYGNVAGKVSIWNSEGLYIVSSDSISSDITPTIQINTPLYVNSNDLLTSTVSPSRRVVAYFLEYRKKSVALAKLLNLAGTDRWWCCIS